MSEEVFGFLFFNASSGEGSEEIPIMKFDADTNVFEWCPPLDD